MLNIIRAELFRSKKSKLFWLILTAIFINGGVYGMSVATSEVFDDIFIMPLFILLAAYFSLMIGREYADGTMRNKIIAGKTKATIYFAQITLSLMTSMIFIGAFFIPFIVIASTTMAANIPLAVILSSSAGFVMSIFVWSILFTVVSILISSREIAAIINFILFFAIMISAYQINHSLGQQEYISTITSELPEKMTPEEVKQAVEGTFEGSYYTEQNDDGALIYLKLIQSGEEMLNPWYIDEPLRAILQPLEYLLPYGQLNAYLSTLTSYMYAASEEDVPFHLFPLYSLCMLAVLIAIGFIAFRKKDLR